MDFDLSKYQICFVVFRKKWFLEIQIQIYVYLIKIKSFDLKNNQIYFQELKKWFFGKDFLRREFHS